MLMAKVEDNLRLHRPAYPSAEQLRTLVAIGNDNDMANVGADDDSAGAQLLYERINRHRLQALVGSSLGWCQHPGPSLMDVAP